MKLLMRVAAAAGLWLAPALAWADIAPDPSSLSGGGLSPEVEAQLMALGASVVIEAVAAAILVGMLRWGSAWRASAAAIVGTLVTHWFLWTGVTAFGGSLGWLPVVVVGEALVVLAEAFFYRFIGGFDWRRAMILSLLVNLASFLLGLAVYLVAR